MIENRRWDPATGITSSLLATSADLAGTVGDIFLRPAQEYRSRRSRSKGPKSRQSDGCGHTGVQSKVSRTSGGSFTTSEDFSSLTQTHPNLETRSQQGSIQDHPHHMAVAGSMVLASGISLGKVPPICYKALIVDWTLAATEGFRGMPRLWGEEVKDYGKVTD